MKRIQKPLLLTSITERLEKVHLEIEDRFFEDPRKSLNFHQEMSLAKPYSAQRNGTKIDENLFLAMINEVCGLINNRARN